MAIFTGLLASVGSFFATTFGLSAGAGLWLANLAANVATSFLVQLLQPRQKQPAFGISGKLQAGDTVPRQFPLGKAMTAGSLVYANEWGTSGKLPNGFFTQVIALSDLPVKGLLSVMVNGVYVTLDASPHADLGYPVLEYRTGGYDYLWIKFYDGTQTTADAHLVSTVSDAARPYASTRVGTGIAYAICHARLNQSLFNGFPQYRFLLDSVKLYDPSKDTTVGGSGSQRWATPSTWGGDGDYLPAVQAYNVLRGISYGGAWLYGFQGMSEYRVPAAHAIAQINACRATVTEDDGPQPMWRAGGMLSVDAECGTALEQIMASCAGRIAESGGIYKLDVGGAFTAVGSVTDGSFLSTEVVQHTPFKGLADMINAVAASYPEPEEGFNMKAAPTLLSSAFETLDGGRRLPASLSLPNVPYAEQVQRLQKVALTEARQENRHTATLGPEWQGIEPNDVIEWTSAKYGYSSTPFKVAAVLDRPDAHVVVDLVEVSADTYDWTTGTEYTLQAKVPAVLRRAPAQTVPGFAVSATTVSLGGGSVPGIKIEWDNTDTMDDARGIRYAVRLVAGSVRKTRGFIVNLDEEEFDVSDNLNPSTAYEVRAKIVADRDTTWTAWTAVTTGTAALTVPVGGLTGILPIAGGGTGYANGFQALGALRGYTTTATAGGTTTLTNASTELQIFTGTAAQTIKVPLAANAMPGATYWFWNQSTLALTVNSNGNNFITTVYPGQVVMVICNATSGGGAAQWTPVKIVTDITPGTVAALPAAVAALTGVRSMVTDANATTFMSAVAGGGANKVPVICDGAAWKIG